MQLVTITIILGFYAMQGCALLWFRPMCTTYNFLKRSIFHVSGDISDVDGENMWWKQGNDEDEVVYKDGTFEMPLSGMSLFDSLYNVADEERSAQYSIGRLSLRDISEAYSFSLAYLGDFVAQLGVSTPINIDSKVNTLLDGDQMYTLLQALSSLDPYDANAGYDSVSVYELAEDLEVTVKKILDLCEKEQINLPFGDDTILHTAVVEQLSRRLEYDDSDLPESEGFSSDFIDVESMNINNMEDEEDEGESEKNDS